jgi:hypothetical protein
MAEAERVRAQAKKQKPSRLYGRLTTLSVFEFCVLTYRYKSTSHGPQGLMLSSLTARSAGSRQRAIDGRSLIGRRFKFNRPSRVEQQRRGDLETAARKTLRSVI